VSRPTAGDGSERGGSGDAGGDGAVLDVDGVSVALGERSVLEDVSLSVGAGRVVGLVGPNGAGKTTLLRTVDGRLTPDRGRVTVAGRDVHDCSARAAARLVATVPQETSVAFDFPVREAVAMGRHPHVSRFGRRTETDRRRVERAMERTDVAAFAERPVTEVSGGERQRVLIARALAQATPLLLLDEPTASLDINHQVRTLELVRELAADGTAVVTAIHDLNLAAHYCDALVLLGDGGVMAAGAPGEVLTEDALASAFDADAVVTRHPVTGSVFVTALAEDRGGDRGRVHVVGGGGTASRYLYLLSAAGFDVSVGALNEGDSDTEAARGLGLDAVTVPPYAPVDDAAAAAVRERVREADATLVADVEVGAGNLANLSAAAAADRLLVVDGRPFTERNYAGDEGRAAYERLRSRGRLVDDDAVLAAVADAVGGASRAPVASDGGGEEETDAGGDDPPRKR
jgi:iron complex transport system ATP-binding protein